MLQAALGKQRSAGGSHRAPMACICNALPADLRLHSARTFWVCEAASKLARSAVTSSCASVHLSSTGGRAPDAYRPSARRLLAPEAPPLAALFSASRWPACGKFSGAKS